MKTWLCLPILLISVPLALGGQTTITGRDPTTWNEDRLSVVIGTLSELRPLRGSDFGLHEAIFSPAATLAGSLDPSLHPRFKVRLHIGGHGTSVESAPPDNAKLIAVIATQSMWRDEPEPSDWIESAICTFMPNYSALVVIDGFDDPLVVETLKRIQAARAKPTTQPSDGAATQPTTQPGQ